MGKYDTGYHAFQLTSTAVMIQIPVFVPAPVTEPQEACQDNKCVQTHNEIVATKQTVV